MESNWVDFKTIKQTVTMLQVLDHYGVKLKPAGKERRGRCPIHKGEGGNSFHANTEKNAFHCFSCQAKGNVLDFVMAIEKCSLRDAALKLQNWFGPVVDNGQRSQLAVTDTKTETGSELSKEKPGDTGEPNTPLTWRLQNVDHAHPYLVERGIDKETAEYFGVGFYSGKGSMRGRIVIPIENEKGELVGYAGRAIDTTEPRYKLPSGFHKSLVLFNLCRAFEETSTGVVVLVEGFFDCMKVTSEHACVALMGCTMSEQQAEQLAANFRQVVVMLDGDEAGRTATQDIAFRLAQRVWVRIINLPDGKQPDQLSTQEIQLFLRGLV